MTLATNAAKGDPKSADTFVNYLIRAAEIETREGHKEMAKMEGVQPAWMEETDPEKRQQLYEQWEYWVDSVRGRRESHVPGFPAPKRQRRSKK